MQKTPHPHLVKLIERYPVLAAVQDQIANCFEHLLRTFEDGHRLYLCGNGGSAADADHIAGELMKAFLLQRPLTDQQRQRLVQTCGQPQAQELADHICQGLPAISLTGHPALATAMANDVGATFTFAQQVQVLGQAADSLLCLSTSGNAANVIAAAQVARSLGMKVIGLTGADGGDLKNWCDAIVRVPADQTHHVQELHVPVYHALCAMLEAAFYADGPAR